VNQTTLLPNFPNPFNPGTTLAFTVSEQDARSLARAVLRIFDPRGRMVREFKYGNLKAGPHALKWDGTDRTGAPCAAGVFICRAVFGKKLFSSTLVLMK
jgi:flagellar hook assembly protein FlgD